MASTEAWQHSFKAGDRVRWAEGPQVDRGTVQFTDREIVGVKWDHICDPCTHLRDDVALAS
jgi:hypothetical protein